PLATTLPHTHSDPLSLHDALPIFTEEGAAVALSPTLTVTDTDDTTLASATVAITGGTFAGDGDVLGFNTSGTSITASYNSATETDRKSTRLNSSHQIISYAVFCLK